VIIQSDVPLEKVIMDKMAEQKQTLSLAESCTGGVLSHLFTQHAGSSSVYAGGAVVYSNELKEIILGVRKETLRKYGAVSEQTAVEMAEGARSRFHTDYAIALTGIAGPGGGCPEKPVGTIWIAIAGPDQTISQVFHFANKRLENIERAAVNALRLLHEMLCKTGR